MKICRAVVLACSGLVLVFPGCAKDSDSKKASSDKDRAVDVDYAFSRGKYEDAIPLLQERVAEDPKNTGDWFRLGYALHSVGRLDEAIDAHARAAKTQGPQRPLALYNWGCALAMSGRKDDAINKLEEAVANGFYRKKTMMDDPELDSLRKDERFLKILESMTPPADSDEVASEHNVLEFWVGEWDLETLEGQRVGRSTVRSEQNGYVLHESFSSGRRSSSSSMTFFDPVADCWKQTIVGSSGRIVYYEGKWDNDALRLQGNAVSRSGTQQKRRFTLKPDRNEGTISWKLEESEDDGETWKVLFDGRLVARKPRLKM